ncbi:MAG TPA: hypothetical protein VK478_12785 [Gemmatimonadaceae bacterium]|nr:hypothetical protein [Gemmatimonadaceae bacterium]
MAKEPNKKDAEEETGGEFDDFMADISQEIAQRVESLDTKPKAKPQPEERKKTPAVPEAGVIVDWPNIADRMIEEMR